LVNHRLAAYNRGVSLKRFISFWKSIRLPEKEEIKVVKTDYAPSPIGQRPTNHPRRFPAAIRLQHAMRVILNVVLPLLVSFAVLSGLPGSQENLEKMGIYLGPTHL